MNPLAFSRFAPVSLAFAAVALFAGCATHEVKVDAMSRNSAGAPSAGSYRICQRDGSGERPLRHQEAARHIKTALSGHGLWEAADPATAELVIELDFGLTEPRPILQEVDVPVFAVPQDQRNQTAVVRPASSVPPRDDERVNGNAEGQFIGFADATQTEVVTEKHLSVSCRENHPAAPGRPPHELWRVTASIESSSRDLREALPVLATAVMQRLGSDTGGTVTDSLASRAPDITFIKKGL
ncbi:MAG: hypothetical protein HZA93_07785 [Verrucomicrobia bacterium]|nr:hypothetical protein [Verrucomicrobiota bacterium]